MASLLQQLLESATRMPGKFVDIATVDPVSAVMLALGSLLMVGSIAFFGLLVLGSLADLLSPSGGGRQFPPAR